MYAYTFVAHIQYDQYMMVKTHIFVITIILHYVDENVQIYYITLS